ncbi:LLM class flavin-dependent oxidoreductase [Roseateles terrae]|uniref:Luciferase family oxidoreductase group 1 n=1 Tax=Roseateles terrae TaxID=431060 RepID=A0ABR6GQ99_9BURK|nr:LLM class flavin-dependent oxidoreductase [Roseateles terrae]MBB3193348.1 luciferase family oxidoreductase group 1 [Roseateles terrae]OWQ89457.1 LLM class flavin-dependent oxidoreductase [Roseateles terrae]
MSAKLSILDLAFVVEGGSPAQALRDSIALAQWTEKLGYERFWVAEHHNMEGVASSATAVLIGQIAAATERIRVGSGGIMLPNHAPLTIAEQFGTLATLFPGRIDLGLGRAPGTDGPTMRALRRHLSTAHEDRFPEDVLELQAYLGPAKSGQVVRAVPGQGTEVPIWLLGSSLYSAQLAAYMGLPFAFASHFAPAMLMQALELYRAQYRPSEKHPKPYAAVGLNIIVAETDAEARHLFTSIQQRFLGMQRGQRGLLPRPIPQMEDVWTPSEQFQVERMLAESIVGSPSTVKAGLQEVQERTGADEFIVACAVHDAKARRRSYELLSGLA